MNTYKIIVTKHAKPWCEIIIDNGVHTNEVLQDSFAQRFPSAEGFSLSYLKSNGERRILQSSPEGIQVLSRDVIFEPYDIKPG